MKINKKLFISLLAGILTTTAIAVTTLILIKLKLLRQM